MAARTRVNLGTHLERITGKSGRDSWPRIFQNLRASCATDWGERYPSHVVANWLGHSPKVAAQHDLMAEDHHFENVVGGCRGEMLPGGGGQGRLPTCDAGCDAVVGDRVKVLARAVVLVAGVKTPEAARVAVPARVTAERAKVSE